MTQSFDIYRVMIIDGGVLDVNRSTGTMLVTNTIVRPWCVIGFGGDVMMSSSEYSTSVSL